MWKLNYKGHQNPGGHAGLCWRRKPSATPLLCQVGSPESPLEDDEFLETERHQKPVHLLQGHRDSYLHFMRHGFTIAEKD